MLTARGDSSLQSRETLASDGTPPRFRISSPQNGDRYQLPAGVNARYATIALRVEGARPSEVRWYINGMPTSAQRMPLVAGTHVISARARASESDEVRVTIER